MEWVCGKIYLVGLGDVCACRLSPKNEKIKRKEKNKMKNRKIVVIAFLVVASLLLGIGYAALTDTLDITGSADVNVSDLEKEYEEDIYFSAAVANEDGNTASVNGDNNDKASFSAKELVKKDDVATFTFTIQNDSAHTVSVQPKLNAASGNTNPEYFSIVSDWDGAAKTIAPNGEITYTLTVTLIKDPTEAVSGSFLIELVATADNATASN